MKETDKILILKVLLKATFIMICVSLGLKLLGLNILEAERDNRILLYISKILENNPFIEFVFGCFLLVVQHYIFFRLCCKNKNIKTYYLATILYVITLISGQRLLYNFFNQNQVMIVYGIYSFVLMILFSIFIDIRIKDNLKLKKSKLIKFLIFCWNRVKRPVLFFLILMVYQIITMFLRNITYVESYDALYKFLLNFDYVILLIATYYLFLKKETNIELQSIFDFTLPQLLDEFPSTENIKVKLSSIKANYEEFKLKNNLDKLVMIIYIILYVLSELVNLGIIVLIANLNHALIECFFVFSSFLISKKIFGAFHFNSAWKCWVVSNLAFFILNKITINAGITIVIPILCGIFLSYITSKFIKKNNLTLYRGMTEEELEKLIKDKKLTKVETGILIDFYCNRMSITKITLKYHYSEASIVRFKRNAMQKLAII